MTAPHQGLAWVGTCLRRPGLTFAAAACAAVLLAVAALLSPGASGAAARGDDDERLARLVSKAITAGDVTGLATLIEEEGVEIDRRLPWEGFRATMLAQAVGQGKTEVAAFLLAQGADVELQTTRRQWSGQRVDEVEAFTPLMVAARADHAAGVELLLANGAAADARGLGEVTALVVAAAFDSAGAAQALVEAKADLEARVKSLEGLAGLPAVFPLSGGPPPAHPVQQGPGFLRIGTNFPATPASVRELPPGAGATALWVAAAVGSEGVVKLLLDAGADREAEASCAGVKRAAAGEEECVPARVAALLGREAVARLLGGDAGRGEVAIRPSDLGRMAPEELRQKIAFVMRDKDEAALEAYLDAGLDVNGVLGAEGGETPLVMACSSSAAPLVKLLLERGARPNEMIHGSLDMTTRLSVERFRIATERLPVVNALLAATRAGCDECLGLLLDAGADVKASVWDGQTPLAAAAERGDPRILARLIEADAPLESAITRVDARSAAKGGCRRQGATPLWIAACSGREEAVGLLLAAGADPDAKAACGDEPRAQAGETSCAVRRIAEVRGKARIVGLIDGEEPAPAPGTGLALSPAQILDRDTKPEARHRGIVSIVRQGDLPGLRALLDGGLDPDELVFDGGFTPLISLAILAGRHELFTLLLERGASTETMSMNHAGSGASNTGFFGSFAATIPKGGVPASYRPVFSPLMYAVFKGNQPAFDRLLELKADVNARGLAGVTALMAAAGRNRAGMAKRLVEAGARIEERTENRERRSHLEADGATALWLAAYAGAPDAARVLLAAGADPSAAAECRARDASPGEKACDARRIAELRENGQVVLAIDEAARGAR